MSSKSKYLGKFKFTIQTNFFTSLPSTQLSSNRTYSLYSAQRHYTEERVHAQAVQDKPAKQPEVYLYIKPISYTFLVSLSYEYKSICRLRIFTARSLWA
jgi:hypothetical protein